MFTQLALFFKTGIVKDLQGKPLWALHIPKPMKDLAASTRTWVNEKHNWNTIVQGYDVFYVTVCDD